MEGPADRRAVGAPSSRWLRCPQTNSAASRASTPVAERALPDGARLAIAAEFTRQVGIARIGLVATPAARTGAAGSRGASASPEGRPPLDGAEEGHHRLLLGPSQVVPLLHREARFTSELARARADVEGGVIGTKLVVRDAVVVEVRWLRQIM